MVGVIMSDYRKITGDDTEFLGIYHGSFHSSSLEKTRGR